MPRLRSAILLLAACGKNPSVSPIDRAGRTTFALGKPCCDRGVYEIPVLPSTTDPDVLALVAGGAEMWKSRAALEVELCGVRTRSDVFSTVFHGELAQVLFSWCSGEKCHAACDTLIAACKAELGEPATHIKGTDTNGVNSEHVRYKTAATYIRMSSIGNLCTIGIQDAQVIGMLEAAIPAGSGE